MSALGPREAESYLAFTYYLKYVKGVEVLAPVVYGPPRIGKTEIIRSSFKLFIKLLAKRALESGLVREEGPLADAFYRGDKAIIAEALEEADEESLSYAAVAALARKCSGPCEELSSLIARVEDEASRRFYEELVASRAFVPSRESLRVWDEGVLTYSEAVDIDEYEGKAVYVELGAEELGEEDLKGTADRRADHFVRLPPRWARALAASSIGLVHFENATVLPWERLREVLNAAVRKRAGLFEFGKLGVISGPDPLYAKVTLIPSYISSGNLEFVALRAPTVREWRERMEGPWAEEVYYFLQVASPNHGEAIKHRSLAPVVEEVSRSIRSADAFLPPPEVAKHFERSFTPYPTPKAWKAFAEALAVGRAGAVQLAYSYLGDESVADLFVEFLSYFTGPPSPERLRELAGREELGARVALAALAFKALEGDEELRKALKEAGLEELLR
ncbi:MAG: hypothetical protein GXO07_02920 [Crenarchaeota archaeon]|nr:hypothetical protein [Thermoproteota archaeon]